LCRIIFADHTGMTNPNTLSPQKTGHAKA
jgi:hypothetical protein